MMGNWKTGVLAGVHAGKTGALIGALIRAQDCLYLTQGEITRVVEE